MTPPFREGQEVFHTIAVNSFGGPATQIGVMHALVVDEKGWISEEEFLDAVDFCMLLPGPEAQQLATWIGWRLWGLRGALYGGLVFILPGLLSMFALCAVIQSGGEFPLVQGALHGLQAVAIALIADAVLRLGRRVLKDRTSKFVAGAALLAVGVVGIPFPLVLLAAAVFGGFEVRNQPSGSYQIGDLRSSARTAMSWLAVWLAPLGVVAAIWGTDSTFTRIAGFFALTATMTFGGAYAVLGWVSEYAQAEGWASAREAAAAIALGESTPGPLIQVVQIFGYLAGSKDLEAQYPWLSGHFGALLSVWMTFAPSFLWILTLAPHMPSIRAVPSLRGALRRITGAVIGVMAHLGLTVARDAVFPAESWRYLPTEWMVDGSTIGLAAAGLVAILYFRLPVWGVALAGAAGGAVLSTLL